MTIPASQYVSVTPSVITAGGTALDLTALFLTTSAEVPIGSIVSFPTASSVGSYFGLSSNEYTAAAKYFGGFDNSTKKPGALMFAQYPTASVAAYLRGGSLASMTLTTLKTLSGTLTIVADGVSKTSSTINLSAATSFSNAATIITAGFSSPGFTVTFDANQSAFVFTSSTTGSTSTMAVATGTLAAGLCLTAITGCVLSQGAVAATPAAFMAAAAVTNQSWSVFTTMFDPDVSGTDNKQAFATWCGLQNNEYIYICTDVNAEAHTANSTTCLGYLLASTSGTALIYDPVGLGHNYFLAGAIASIDFAQTKGRTNLKFRTQSGLMPSVTDATIAATLETNGYNCVAQSASGTAQWTFLTPGSITGTFKWIDAFANQIWMNSGFQSALMALLINAKSIPYSDAGYSMIEAACLDVINSGLNFSAIQPNVPLTAAQAAEVNAAAGVAVDSVLGTRGWYLKVGPATGSTRAARQSPPCVFWYMDGGSVNKINLASIDIQ